MQEHNIKEFLETICSQIKYKSIHKSITDEILDHIEEQKYEYKKQGFNEETATEKALEQMGDPVLVGMQLDKAHRPRNEWSILSLALTLVIIGGAVQYFLSVAGTFNENGFSHFLFYAPVGVAAFICTYFFDYTILGCYSKLVYFTLFIVAFSGFFILDRVCGTYTHVYYFSLLFIPVFGAVVYGLKNKGYIGIVFSGLFYLGVAFICIIGPRVSGLVQFSISCLVVLTIAIVKGYFGGNKKVSLSIVYFPVIFTVTLIIMFLLQNDLRRSRVLSLINPESDPLGMGYQQLMVKRLFTASQPFGKAVLEGNLANTPIHQYLPGWSTDFSLTYIIANLGYVAGLVIVITLLILIVRMFISVSKQKNALGFLVSFAASLAIAGQFVLYVLANIGVITFAWTLPLISYGGSGFVVNMILIGLVLSVYRRTDIVIDKLQYSRSGRQIITFEEGKLIIDFGFKRNRV